MPVPLIAVLGAKDAGKTTLIEALTKELSRRGYKVGTVKHIPHPGFTIDLPNSDTWRHAHAGAKAVAAVSPDEITVIRRIPEADVSLDVALKFFNPDEVDVIIIEGFKRQIKDRVDIPKIVVLKSKEELAFLGSYANIIMTVSDTPDNFSLDLPCFAFDEIGKIIDTLGVALKKKLNIK